MELKKVKDQVEYVLTNHPRTRGDDFILFAMVCVLFYKVKPNTNFCSVMTQHNEYELPAWGSIDRARRKLQAERPELRAPEAIDKARIDRQADYIEFAQEG